jgi:hypothetical protein
LKSQHPEIISAFQFLKTQKDNNFTSRSPFLFPHFPEQAQRERTRNQITKTKQAQQEKIGEMLYFAHPNSMK